MNCILREGIILYLIELKNIYIYIIFYNIILGTIYAHFISEANLVD